MSATATLSAPGIRRILSALAEMPGMIGNEIAAAANLTKKSTRTYIRILEKAGAIHHSHWTEDPNFRGMFRRGFTAGPAVSPAPELPSGARNKGNPGRKTRPVDESPPESRMPAYALMLGALTGQKLPQERKAA